MDLILSIIASIALIAFCNIKVLYKLTLQTVLLVLGVGFILDFLSTLTFVYLYRYGWLAEANPLAQPLQEKFGDVKGFLVLTTLGIFYVTGCYLILSRCSHKIAKGALFSIGVVKCLVAVFNVI